MQINGISSSNSNNIMQGSQDAVEQLKQQKANLEMYIAQLSSQDAEKNSGTIEKLQNQLKELETKISETQTSASTSQVNTSSEISSMSKLEENIGPAYKVDISNQAISLQEASKQIDSDKQAQATGEKIIDEKFL